MSKSVDIAIRSIEKLHEQEANSKLTARMAKAAKDFGAVDTFRYTVLSLVASENYNHAIEEIKGYVEDKASFPAFKERAGRYASYSIDLVNAVKAKRSFPGMQHLSMSKQQDLFDRAMDHFDDLKQILKKIEQVDREVRLEDVRSTVWVVKAVIYCFFAIVALGIFRELTRGVIPASAVVFEQATGDATNWIFDRLGF